MALRILFGLFIVLPFVIFGQKTSKIFANEVAVLNKYAENGTMIADNGLILTKNGFFGERSAGFIYAGRLASEKRHPVAIKFLLDDSHYGALNELKIFKHMQADIDAEVEKFGIPAVHYYGKWKHFILIAITELAESLHDIKKRRTISPLEIMIWLKNFVIQSKYMHKHGVCHGSIPSESIMIRSNQSFIVDFNGAKIMEEQRAYLLTHDDWIFFLYTILQLCNIDSWDKFIKRGPPKHISDDGLSSVIRMFGVEAFSANRSKHFPNYYRLKTFIDKMIENQGLEK